MKLFETLVQKTLILFVGLAVIGSGLVLADDHTNYGDDEQSVSEPSPSPSPFTTAILGYIFEDQNSNGQRDPGEALPPLPTALDRWPLSLSGCAIRGRVPTSTCQAATVNYQGQPGPYNRSQSICVFNCPTIIINADGGYFVQFPNLAAIQAGHYDLYLHLPTSLAGAVVTTRNPVEVVLDATGAITEPPGQINFGLDLSAVGASPSPSSTPTVSYPSHFKVANDSVSNLATAQEQTFTGVTMTIPWQLSEGAGTKTVYVQFKVDGVWQNPISASVAYITASATPTPATTTSPTATTTTTTTSPSPAAQTQATFSPYDLNSDGRVNSVDAAIFLQQWRTNSRTIDFNQDSAINSFDYALLKKNLNQ